MVYNKVMYCNDYYQCSLMGKCNKAEENCYIEEGNIVKVFIPHFSSIILVLNSSTINLTLASPDNAIALTSGEDIYLNFTTNITVMASYLFDAGDYTPLGNNNAFSSKLNGSLQFGVIKNGQHNLTIYLMDNISEILNYTYSFTVNDAIAPTINVSIDNKKRNSSIINGNNYSKEITIVSDEFSIISYRLNDEEYKNVDLGKERSAATNVEVEDGINNLTINASDMHGNNKVDFYA